jgi:choline dehydrogenase-like flavoprotein
MSDYEVIVIGSGAGGGTLVRHLAPSGKRILLLERGDWLPREPQNWLARDVFVDNRYVSPDTWYDGEGKPFQPQVHYFVGGATKLYGAALYRLRKEDFGELRHHDGISPAWPIAYEEMEPYYTRAEQLYRVHGARGEDPTEPPASAPYPFPAVSHEPRIQQLADDLAAAGHHPFHAPCGVMLEEEDMPHSACVRCSTCDGFPCLVQAKSDAEVLGVRPALEHTNVTLMTNAQAVRLETNDAGTAVTGVVVQRDGARETYTGDLVIVSCGAANSAKLLLASASDAHPNGLANGSDQVGRNYMFHNCVAVLALSKEPNPTVFQKTLGLNDFYFGTDDVDYPLGNIQMVGKSQAEAGARVDPGEGGAPRGRLLALDRGPPAAGEPGDPARRREHRARLHRVQRRAQEAAAARAQVAAQRPRDAARPPATAPRVPQERHPGGGLCPPGGHVPLRDRPGRLGARHRLPGARGRQPLRRRHELLPEHRRREPGADRDGQRGARGGPSPGAPGGYAGRTGAGACPLT